MIHAERRALATDLADIGPDQWAAPSLCSGWTVREVLAHMTATAKITPAKFLPGIVGSGFSFEKLQAKGVAAELGQTPSDTLSRFTEVAAATSKPPGPIDTALGETLVHSEDIRRVLGIKHEYDPAALEQVADFYRRSNLIIGGKKRAAELTFRATDADWTAGSGPEVSGPMLSLTIAIAGRKAALDDLEGAGVETLRARA
ncbi:MAG TPA: maleylpyruvate isomerase family mycothiol-dependent enzyme [Acidimicrobiales bacterium]